MTISNYIAQSEFYELTSTATDICISEDKDVSDIYTFVLNNPYKLCCLCDNTGAITGILYKDDIEKSEYDKKALIISSKKNIFYYDRKIANFDIDYFFYNNPHRYIPLIDRNKRIKGIVINKRPSSYLPKRNPVVLMAGGLGMRLRPYTEKVPKPLLEVGGVSILERILTYFRYYGFRNFYISVNYLAEQIEDTIGDGSRFGLDIHYLHEKKWLGTAGAIALMPRPEMPCLVSNGDLIMDVDLDKFLQRHQALGASGTMCTYCYAHKIAYGVVQSQDGEYQGIAEKPTHYFQVNTGLYCISPEAWNYFPEGEKVDMPTLFDDMSKDGCKVCVYPHEGKWIDIGTLNEFERLIAGDGGRA